ncbi:MAG: DUF1573 domain-containing protein [Planctomycetota bacterium]|jgi:hypothetical protein
MTHPPDIPRPTLRRQLRAAAALVLIIAGVIGAAYGAYWVAVGRPALGGDHDHEFGVTELDGDRVSLQHTFRLTNRRSRTVEIEGIRTTCGCAVASTSADALEPGETVQIAARLTLSQDGRKKARIFLELGDGGVDVLRLEAAVRKKQRLVVPVGTVTLETGRALERVVLFFDYDSNDMPPPPVMTAPPGVRAAFTSWTQDKRRRRSKGLPARWRGKLVIEQFAEAMPADALLLVEVGSDQKLAVPLRAKDEEGGVSDERLGRPSVP